MPILGFARPAALEPHQRADRIATLIGRNIDAHHRPRNDRQAEIPPQGEDRVGRPLIDVECLDLEAVEQVACVLVGQLDQLGGRAALRDDKFHARRQLAECVQVGRRKGQYDPLSALFEREVIAHEKRAQHVALRSVFDVLQEAVLARDELAVANAEDDTDRVVAIARQADRVSVAASDDFHGLRLLELVQPLQGIAQLRCPFVILRVARFLHPLAQPGSDVERLPRKKQQHIVDHAPVVFDALIADARRLATLDMKVEAGPIWSFFRQVPGAGPHRENAADDLQRLP